MCSQKPSRKGLRGAREGKEREEAKQNGRKMGSLARIRQVEVGSEVLRAGAWGEHYVGG